MQRDVLPAVRRLTERGEVDGAPAPALVDLTPGRRRVDRWRQAGAATRPSRYEARWAAEVLGVVAGAVDERRLAAAQEGHAHQVHARRVDDDAAVVADQPLAVEHRHVQPGVVGAEAGGPDDRADLAAGEVDAQRWRVLDDRRSGSPGGLELTVEPVLGRPLVDRVEQPAELEVGQRAHVAQRPGELRPPVADPGESPDEADPDRRQGVEIERRPRRCADDLQRREPAHPDDVVDLVVALVHHADVVHPPLDVAAPVDPRARTWAPTATVTGRPDRWISSASWMPVADAPTISTPPSASWPGFRYASGVTRSMPAGNVGGEAGEMGDVAGPGRHDDRRRRSSSPRWW